MTYRSRSVSWISVPTLMVAIGVAGCGGDGLPRAPQVGDPPPDLAFETLAGDSIRLSDLGGAPTLINLWATWCGPCREEIPFLQSIHEEYGPRGLRVVGISADNAGARDQVEDFLSGAGVTYANALDPRSRSLDAFQLLGLPATFLVDGEGRIALARRGPVSEADLRFMKMLEKLVASTGTGAMR